MTEPFATSALRPGARLGVLSLALLVLASTEPAQAAGGGGEDALRQTAWQAFNLVLLIGVIVWAARGPVMSFFGERRNQIQNDLDDAARLLSEAETRNSELQRRIVDLGSEVEEIRETTRARAEEESERILAEARKAAERIRADATAAVEQELRRARRELRDEAASLALTAAADILRDEIAESDRDRLLDEFITRVEPSNGG
jgi:F-type H+-transporting ATPase subunit b